MPGVGEYLLFFMFALPAKGVEMPFWKANGNVG